MLLALQAAVAVALAAQNVLAGPESSGVLVPALCTPCIAASLLPAAATRQLLARTALRSAWQRAIAMRGALVVTPAPAHAGGLPVGCQQLITTQDKAYAGVRTVIDVFEGFTHGACEDKLRELEPTLPITESIAADYARGTCTVYRGSCRPRVARGVQALDLVCHPTVDPGPECVGGADSDNFQTRSSQFVSTATDEDVDTSTSGTGASGRDDAPSTKPPPAPAPAKQQPAPRQAAVAEEEPDAGGSNVQAGRSSTGRKSGGSGGGGSRRHFYLRRFRQRRTYRGWRTLLGE